MSVDGAFSRICPTGDRRPLAVHPKHERIHFGEGEH
jgi:hypothetical protein